MTNRNHQYSWAPHTRSSSQHVFTYFPLEVCFLLFFFSQETCWSLTAFSSVPSQSHNTNSGGPYRGPSCRHVCSAAYLFKPAAGPGGPAQASPGASPACLRIHSHLRIKLLTLMLLVMLGPAPIFEPINLQKLGNIGHVGEKKKKKKVDMIQGVFC